MYKCVICDKEFLSVKALGGHKPIHKEGPRYSKPRSKPPKVYACLYCGKESTWGCSKENKFCSNQCQRDYVWETVSKPKIENGGGGNLKRYLIEKYGEICSCCGLGNVWNGKPLVLQLDHIDGDSDNNFPSNIRLLCPNCHTQTSNFGSKGKGSRYKKITKRNSYLREYKRPDA